MQKQMYLFSTAVIVAFLLSIGCGKVGQKSPAEIVKAAYTNANEGKYTEAEKYLSSEVYSAMKGGFGGFGGGAKNVWDEATRNGTIERIEILKEEIRGDGAKVYFRLYFKDGITKDI